MAKNEREEIINQNNNEDQVFNETETENESFVDETNVGTSSNETLFELDSIEEIQSNDKVILPSKEEHTPKLFSDDVPPNDDISSNEDDYNSTESEQKLFAQESNHEEDFEIPACLRRQKFY